MEVFSGYFMTIKPYIYFCAFTAFVLLLYTFAAILKIPTRVFLMPVRGAGYTLLTLYKYSGIFFLPINREKIRLFEQFPSDFLRTYFKL